MNQEQRQAYDWAKSQNYQLACNMAFICQLMKQEGAERNSEAGRQWWQRYE